MEFKKIDDTKFQCLLFEEDLEDNNISLDDFFRNDTEKIHGLLDVVMEEAQKHIGISMNGGVMSLQLAPQPNHSILLTISSGKEDFGNMLKHAGEQAIKAMESLDKNVIKKDESEKGPSLTDDNNEKKIFPGMAQGEEKTKEKETQSNYIKANTAVFRLENLQNVEEFCSHCPRTWGIINSLYRDEKDGSMFLILEKGRSSEEKYKVFTNILMEYGEFISSKEERIAYIKEHCEVYIKANAINIIKRYCC